MNVYIRYALLSKFHSEFLLRFPLPFPFFFFTSSTVVFSSTGGIFALVSIFLRSGTDRRSFLFSLVDIYNMQFQHKLIPNSSSTAESKKKKKKDEVQIEIISTAPLHNILVGNYQRRNRRRKSSV